MSAGTAFILFGIYFLIVLIYQTSKTDKESTNKIPTIVTPALTICNEFHIVEVSSTHLQIICGKQICSSNEVSWVFCGLSKNEYADIELQQGDHLYICNHASNIKVEYIHPNNGPIWLHPQGEYATIIIHPLPQCRQIAWKEYKDIIAPEGTIVCDIFIDRNMHDAILLNYNKANHKADISNKTYCDYV